MRYFNELRRQFAILRKADGGHYFHCDGCNKKWSVASSKDTARDEMDWHLQHCARYNSGRAAGHLYRHGEAEPFEGKEVLCRPIPRPSTPPPPPGKTYTSYNDEQLSHDIYTKLDDVKIGPNHPEMMDWDLWGGGSDDLYHNPLKRARGAWNLSKHGLNHLDITHPSTRIEDVHPSKIYSGQHTVNAEILYKKMLEPQKDAPPHEPYSYPRLAYHKGRYYVIDGNHRVVAALLRGDPAVRAMVTDYEPPKGGYRKIVYPGDKHAR